MENKALLKDSVKSGIKISFAISYWITFGSFILIGLIAKGIGLAIALSILFGFGYWLIKTLMKICTKKGRKQREKNKSHLV